MRFYILLSFLFVSFFYSTIIFSQEEIDSYFDLDTEYDEVIIQGNRLQIPFSDQNRDIMVLDRKLIESLPVQSLNELLAYVSGVDMRQRGPWGTQADVSINGGTFEQTLVLLNGMKVIDPQTGHNMLNLPISPDAIQRIEILKGAAASIYGINALNGVINIVTRQPSTNEVRVGVDVGSSFQRDVSNNKLYAGLGLTASSGFVTKATKHFVNLSSIQSNGFRYNTAMQNHKVFYQGNYRLNQKSQLQFMGGFVYNDFGANGFYAPPGDIESKETIQTGIFSLNGKFNPNEKWQIQPSVNYRYNQDHYVFIRDKPEIYENLHQSNVLNVLVDNSVKTSIGVVGIGLEYRTEDLKSNSLGNHARDNYGLYSGISFNKIGGFQANIGAYLNYSKHFSWQLLPSIDLGYEISSSWQIFANSGTGTRVPTYTDWYYQGPQNIGNSNLTPEKSFHNELGSKFKNDNFTFSLSGFYRQTSDIIDWVRDSLEAPWQPQNFQSVRMLGLNLSADYRLFSPKNANGISIISGLSYTWLNPKISDSKNYVYSHYALENLRNQVVARLDFGFLEKYHISIVERYQQRVNYKDYFLTDLKISQIGDKLDIALSINNLTNVTYVETSAVPLPGRWVGVSILWKALGKK